MVTIRQCSCVEIIGNLPLIDEYADECAIRGFPRPQPSLQMYMRMEEAGLFSCFGAYSGDKMVGFCTLLTHMLPHYSRLTTVVESLFLSKQYRTGVAGIKLLNACKLEAKAKGAASLLVSAPAGGQLEKLLTARKIPRTNSVFMVELNG